MIGGLKPYDAMTDSRVPWLGEVPEHWEVLPLKRIGWFKSGTGFPLDQQGRRDLEIPFLKVSDMNLPENRAVMRTWNNAVSRETAVRLGATIFPSGSILFPKVGGAMLTNKRRTSDRPCCIDNNLMGCVVLQGNPGFALWLMQHLDLGSIAKPGPVPAISEGEVREIKIGSPPLPEQAAIVRFLDHSDRRIRRYIRAKQKLIKLLEEQKQAIIHRAVTRGLDPTVRLRPSGVEWLGEVPEHWEVSRVKTEFSCLNHRRIPLSGTERGAMTLRRYDYYGASGVIDKVDDYLFDDDLLLIAEDGANLVLRNLPLAIIARGKFWVNNHAHILKAKRGNLEYLAAVMERINYQPWISGAAQPKLTQDRLMSIAIAVAPPEEQNSIAASVENEAAPLRAAIDRARRETSLLREYRTRLIADVVTGKLDVREAAVRLADEAEEAEPLNDADDLAEPEEESENDLEAVLEEAEA